MTTLNGIPRSWDSFIHGICSIRRIISFNRLHEECVQEEAQLMIREENMGATEYQSLIVHTRKNYKKKEKKDNYHHNNKNGKKQKKIKRDPSNVRCYTCDEKGHFARDCPTRKKSRHAHVVEDEEPTNKRFRREKDDSN